MSSSSNRDPLSGIIRQDSKVVGSICLPEEDLLDFINQFNHCYGPLRLHIDAPKTEVPNHLLLPVGAGLRNPLRPPPSMFRDANRPDRDASNS
jgi:hypothetical protein